MYDRERPTFEEALHGTKTSEELTQIRESTEQFIEEFAPYVEAIAPEEAKELHTVFKNSVGRNPEAREVHWLNARYHFAKRGEVPQAVEALIDFLSDRSFIAWNEVIKMLFLRFNPENE
jgi:hypothetical protein